MLKVKGCGCGGNLRILVEARTASLHFLFSLITMLASVAVSKPRSSVNFRYSTFSGFIPRLLWK